MKDLNLIKKKKQIVIQTWHASYALKEIEKNAKNLTKHYIYESKLNSKNTNYFISNSVLQTQDFLNSFWNIKTIWEFGNPKNDIFFKDNRESLKNDIKKKLNVLNKKIILYMPTFRDDGSTKCYNLDLNRVLDKFNFEKVIREDTWEDTSKAEYTFDMSKTNILNIKNDTKEDYENSYLGRNCYFTNNNKYYCRFTYYF